MFSSPFATSVAIFAHVPTPQGERSMECPKITGILIICILRFRRTVNLNHCNSAYLRHCRMLYLHVGIHPFLNDVCLFNQHRKVFWTDINAEVIRVYEQSKISAIGNVEFNFTELGYVGFNVAVKKERRNVDYRDPTLPCNDQPQPEL